MKNQRKICTNCNMRNKNIYIIVCTAMLWIFPTQFQMEQKKANIYVNKKKENSKFDSNSMIFLLGNENDEGHDTEVP